MPEGIVDVLNSSLAKTEYVRPLIVGSILACAGGR